MRIDQSAPAAVAIASELLQAPVYDLVVVIVNWNVRDLLARCLESVALASEGISTHTVVVDNASSDGSCAMVRGAFPSVELLDGSANLGFARANNLVLHRYRDSSKYMLLLNPDSEVAPDTFRRMLEFMEAHPDAGIAGCKVIKPDGTLDWPCKRSYITPSVLLYRALRLDRQFPQSRRFGRYHLTFLDSDHVHEVDAVVGAFLMIRQKCLREIGLMDECFFMYGEDLEWCYRAKNAGWKVYYVPTTQILHYKGQSTGGKNSNQMIYHWYRSTWLVYKKQIAHRYAWPVNALVWAGFHAMSGVSRIANFLRREKRVPSRR